MANGAAVTNNFNGMIGADSATDAIMGGAGTVNGNGGNATINRQGNIYMPMGAALTVSDTATGGLAAGTGNGGNAAVTTNGNIVSTSHLLSSISFFADAVAGAGAKDGNATATMNGNIITYNNATATNVSLHVEASDPLDLPGQTGSAFGTKSATLNGNIVTGNVNDVNLMADALLANSSATINGNIVSTKPTDTGTVTVEATAQKIAINGNIFTLGQQNVVLELNEIGPNYKASVAGNIFNGTGNNTFTLVETQSPVAPSPDTVSINLGTNSFTFDGQSNILNKFGSIALVGDIQGTITGTSGNNTLDASGDTTTGTLIFQGNGGTDTITGGPNALNVVQFAGSDWQYTITPNLNQPFPNGTNVSTIPANIIAPNAIIPASNDTLNGIQRLKFNSPANVRDLNDDGYGDLVFQNNANGNLQVRLEGPGPNPPIAVTGIGGVTWQVVGTGQFTPDTDRNAGILLQKTGNGQMEIVTSITGTPTVTALSGALVTPTTFTGWTAISTGDFNGDAASDILLQQGPGGPVEIAFLNTKFGEPIGQVDAITAVSSPTGGNWNAISAGDFNADGNSDILWQNSASGAVDVSLMTGATGGPASVGTAATGFTAFGTGDFNGDGKSDILFGDANGDAQIWLMNGTSQSGPAINVASPGAGWTLKGAEDVNKDGFSDLIWQNTTSGAIDVQEMTTGGATLGGLTTLTAAPVATFHLIASTGGG